MKKQFVSALLLMAMLASLASCGGTSGTSDTSASDTDTTAPVDNTVDANGFLLDELPADLNFGGKEVNILIREAKAPTEFFVEEQTGDIVDDSLYSRNQAIEDRLGVKLNYIPMPGEWEHRDTFNGAIKNSVLAADGAYDLCAVLSNQLSVLTLEGLLTNLSTLDYLDFDKPWWSKGLLDELAVDDKLYFVSGDASLGLIKGMMCVFYNKQLCEDYGFEGLYDVVNEGKWTIDYITELTKDVYQDLDGSGTKTEQDMFGFTVGDYNQLYGFIDSFNLQILERDSDGYPSTFVFDNEHAVDAYQKLVSIFKDNNDFYTLSSDANQASMHDEFRAQQSIFCTGEFGDTDSYRDISDFDYGVLPFPKYDEAQKEHRTTARATYSSFCIPKTASDPEMVAAVLECFASESYRKVSPTYFESALKVKYSRDDESAMMFDLIKSSVTFSFATSFTTSIGDPQNTWKGQLAAFSENWMSKMATWQPASQTKLDEALAILKELE
ncbi:MAG: hypothetical protein E7632_04165 [Ruminococcaceae bacterium]|nr:hypothetical protein [Oscillospiraceae bacterium]